MILASLQLQSQPDKITLDIREHILQLAWGKQAGVRIERGHRASEVLQHRSRPGKPQFALGDRSHERHVGTQVEPRRSAATFQLVVYGLTKMLDSGWIDFG